MAATYRFSPNGALDTIDELTFVTAKLRESLDALTGQVNLFITANEGSAPTSYAEAQTLWNQGHQEMDNSLRFGSDRLRQILDEYVIGDRRGAQVFGRSI
ncbi:hypothetical protein UG55_100314 [Frankia sp. EI5c]|uniref:WXG100 family type VII secretion target n=1 Tax=Frankia sp. EI5c TaxID=683316 RepID=UPI0007C3FA8E|nr:hypothetical protein [Frankia sp. EI5c]OAA29203.1 hypothetical protein UG55_100314 [Frankia sp. EI5c]